MVSEPPAAVMFAGAVIAVLVLSAPIVLAMARRYRPAPPRCEDPEELNP